MAKKQNKTCAQHLISRGCKFTVTELAEKSDYTRTHIDRLARTNIKRLDEVIDSHLMREKLLTVGSVTWDEYRERMIQYRIEAEPLEQVAVLLLGISEEYDEYMQERINGGTVEKQVEEFGDFLYNVAELNNVLSEHFKAEYSDINGKLITSPSKCVQIVRKLYMRDKDYAGLITKACEVAHGMTLAYTTMITTTEAMKSSIIKMKARHG